MDLSFFGHQPVVYLQKWFLCDCLVRRRRQLCSLETTFSVNLWSYFKFATERSGRALDDRDLRFPDLVENVEGILSGVLYERVSC